MKKLLFITVLILAFSCSKKNQYKELSDDINEIYTLENEIYTKLEEITKAIYKDPSNKSLVNEYINYDLSKIIVLNNKFKEKWSKVEFKDTGDNVIKLACSKVKNKFPEYVEGLHGLVVKNQNNMKKATAPLDIEMLSIYYGINKSANFKNHKTQLEACMMASEQK